MSIKYIYEPEKIKELLKQYPKIAAALPDPDKEGEKTLSFPHARKTARDLYIPFSYSKYYEHLDELLRSLEECLQKGWDKPSLVKASNKCNYSTLLSEMYIAKCFLNKKYKVSNYDREEGLPDLIIENNNQKLSLEVYCPRDFEGYEEFKDNLRHAIFHLDERFDYDYAISIEQINFYRPDGYCLHFDPWGFSKLNDNFKKRWEFIEPIVKKIQENLKKNIKSLDLQFEYQQLNSRISLNLTNIKESETFPIRHWSFKKLPGIHHNPPGMLQKLLANKVLNKLKEKQALADAIKGFAIDISYLRYFGEFFGNFYFNQLVEAAESILNHPNFVKENVFDIIAFCSPRDVSNGNISVPIIYLRKDTNISCLDFFGGLSRFTKHSDTIYYQ